MLCDLEMAGHHNFKEIWTTKNDTCASCIQFGKPQIYRILANQTLCLWMCFGLQLKSAPYPCALIFKKINWESQIFWNPTRHFARFMPNNMAVLCVTPNPSAPLHFYGSKSSWESQILTWKPLKPNPPLAICLIGLDLPDFSPIISSF